MTGPKPHTPWDEIKAGRRVTVAFDGGPWDGDEVEGLVARVIAMHEPPYVCVYADGRHEHYELAESVAQRPREATNSLRYEYRGPCRQIEDHGDDGHRHE